MPDFMSSKIRFGKAKNGDKDKIIGCIRDDAKAFRNVLDNDQYTTLIGSKTLVDCFREHVASANNRQETKLRIRDHFPRYNFDHQLIVGQMLAQLSHLDNDHQNDANKFLTILFESRRVKKAFTELAAKNLLFAECLLDNNFFISQYSILAGPMLRKQIVEENNLSYFQNNNPVLQQLLFGPSCLPTLVTEAQRLKDPSLAHQLLNHNIMKTDTHQQKRLNIIVQRLSAKKEFALLDNDGVTAEDITIILNNPHFSLLKERIFFTGQQAGVFLAHEKILAINDVNHLTLFNLYIKKYWQDTAFLLQFLTTPQAETPLYQWILDEIFTDKRTVEIKKLFTMDNELSTAFLCNPCVKNYITPAYFVTLFVDKRLSLADAEWQQILKALHILYANDAPKPLEKPELFTRIINSDPTLAEKICPTDLVNDFSIDNITSMCLTYKENPQLITTLFKQLCGQQSLDKYLLQPSRIKLLGNAVVWNYLLQHRKSELTNSFFLKNLIVSSTPTVLDMKIILPIIQALTENKGVLKEQLVAEILPLPAGVSFIFNIMPSLLSFVTDEILVQQIVNIAKDKDNEKLGTYLDILSGNNKALHDILNKPDNIQLVLEIFQHENIIMELGYENLFTLLKTHQQDENNFDKCISTLLISMENLEQNLIEFAMNDNPSAQFVLLEQFDIFKVYYGEEKLAALVTKMEVILSLDNIINKPNLWYYLSEAGRVNILKETIKKFANNKLTKEKFAENISHLNLDLIAIACTQQYAAIADLLLTHQQAFKTAELLSEVNIQKIIDATTSQIRRKHKLSRSQSGGDIQQAQAKKSLLPQFMSVPVVVPQKTLSTSSTDNGALLYTLSNTKLPAIDDFLASLSIKTIIDIIISRHNKLEDEIFQHFINQHNDGEDSHVVQISQHLINNMTPNDISSFTDLFLNAPALFQGWKNFSGDAFFTGKQRLTIASALGTHFIRATAEKNGVFKSTLVNIIYPMENNEANGDDIYCKFIENLKKAIEHNYCHTAVNVVISCGDDVNLLRILLAYYKAAERDFAAMLKPKVGGMFRKAINYTRGDGAKFAEYFDSILKSEHLNNIFDALGADLLDLIIHYSNPKAKPYLINDNYNEIIAAAANNFAIANALFPKKNPNAAEPPIWKIGFTRNDLYQNIVTGEGDQYNKIRGHLGKRYLNLFLQCRDKCMFKAKKTQKIFVGKNFLEKHTGTLFALAATDREISYQLAKNYDFLYPIQRLLLDNKNPTTDVVLKLMGEEILTLSYCRGNKGFTSEDWTRILTVATEDNQLAIKLGNISPYFQKITQLSQPENLILSSRVLIRILQRDSTKANSISFPNTLSRVLKNCPLEHATPLVTDKFLLEDMRRFQLIDEEDISSIAKQILKQNELSLTEIASLLVAVCHNSSQQLFREILLNKIFLKNNEMLTMAYLRNDSKARSIILESRIEHLTKYMIEAIIPSQPIPQVAPQPGSPTENTQEPGDNNIPPPPPCLIPPLPSGPQKFVPPQGGLSSILGDIRKGAELKKANTDKKTNNGLSFAEQAQQKLALRGNMDWSKIGQKKKEKPTTFDFKASLKSVKNEKPKDPDSTPKQTGPRFFKRSNIPARDIFEIPCFDKFIVSNFCRRFINIPSGDRINVYPKDKFVIESEKVKKTILSELQQLLLTDLHNYVKTFSKILQSQWATSNITEEQLQSLNDALTDFCQSYLFDSKPLGSKEKKDKLNDIHLTVFKKKAPAAKTVAAINLLSTSLHQFDTQYLAEDLIKILVKNDSISPEAHSVLTLIKDFKGKFATAIDTFITQSLNSCDINSTPNKDQVTDALQERIKNALKGRNAAMHEKEEEPSSWDDDEDEKPEIPGIKK